MNDFSKNFIDVKNSMDIPTIWISATLNNNFSEINYITNMPLDANYYKYLTFEDERNLIFNNENKSPIENFVTITLIRPEIGLNDDPNIVQKLKNEGKGGILNKYITPKTKDDVSLVEEVIYYFQNKVYLCLNKRESYSTKDGGTNQKRKLNKKSKLRRKSRR